MRKIQGTHLLVDGYVKNKKSLEPCTVHGMFDKLVDALGMTYLTPPTATKVPLNQSKIGTDLDEGGTSYWCQITTSHISLHAWPLRLAFMMDVFSCLSFNTNKALDIIKKSLDTAELNYTVVFRVDPKDSCGQR